MPTQKGSGLVHCPSPRVSKRAGSLGGGMCFRCYTYLGNGNNVGVLFVFVPPVTVGCSGSSRLAAK